MKPPHETNTDFVALSHPTWVRGLKLLQVVSRPPTVKSHPTWVRGLKQCKKSDFLNTFSGSHPTWVRGLKLSVLGVTTLTSWSHPTWVRGLKPYEQLNSRVYRLVAPYVGAWIEIR